MEAKERLKDDNALLRRKLQRVRDSLKFSANSEGGIVAEIDEVLRTSEQHEREADMALQLRRLAKLRDRCLVELRDRRLAKLRDRCLVELRAEVERLRKKLSIEETKRTEELRQAKKKLVTAVDILVEHYASKLNSYQVLTRVRDTIEQAFAEIGNAPEDEKE